MIPHHIRQGRAGSIRMALGMLFIVFIIWGGMKLEQWATAHNGALVEAE